MNTAWDEVESERTGAVVTFGGIVRNHDGGKEVVKLTYSAHPSANARMVELVAEVASRHPGTRLWAAHRVGELQIGDAALVAAAASAHRGEAFEACRDLVETVKAQRAGVEGTVLRRRARRMGRQRLNRQRLRQPPKSSRNQEAPAGRSA